jgi:phage RecT family recombinase
MSSVHGNAIVRRPVVDLLKSRMDAMLRVVPESERDRFREAAIGVGMSKSIADCTPESVASAIYYCFRWGFAPDPGMRQVAIVPFREKGVKSAKPILMYNGLIDLARNADPSLQLRTGIVYDNDDYEFVDGTTRRLTIKYPHWLKGEQPGTPLFSWCAYRTKHQAETETVIVPFPELDTLRKRAIEKSYNGNTPWDEEFGAMSEKTAIRRASKKWTFAPYSEAGRRLREAVAADDGEGELPEVSSEIGGDDERPATGTAAVAKALGVTPTNSPSPQSSPSEADDTEDVIKLDGAAFQEACVAALTCDGSDHGAMVSGPAIAATASWFKSLKGVKKWDDIAPQTRREFYRACRAGKVTEAGTITD